MGISHRDLKLYAGCFGFWTDLDSKLTDETYCNLVWDFYSFMTTKFVYFVLLTLLSTNYCCYSLRGGAGEILV